MRKYIWLDIETTGLDVQEHEILEVAVVITDENLTIIKEKTVLIDYHNDKAMNDFCRNMHTRNGLLDDIKIHGTSLRVAEGVIYEFLERTMGDSTSPMCGSTIHFDRKFLEKHMPRLNKFFHYRNLDVSSCKTLYNEFLGNALFAKGEAHRALEDTYESIRHYKHIVNELKKLKNVAKL